MTTPRFELKYRITEDIAAAIREVASFHMEPDAHSTEGEYTVNSLYFDTPYDEDAHETGEGVVMRSKVRLRCYSRQPKPPFFLELKQRFGTSIYKKRAALGSEDAERIVNGLPPVAAYENGKSNEEIDGIREVIDHRDMTPRVWVQYARTAWVSPWGDGARMTLDRCLETQGVEPCAALAPSSNGWSFPELDDRIVLELKFFGSAPRWMQRLAQDFELERTSCSKYGLGLFALEQSPAISILAAAS